MGELGSIEGSVDGTVLVVANDVDQGSNDRGGCEGSKVSDDGTRSIGRAFVLDKTNVVLLKGGI